MLTVKGKEGESFEILHRRFKKGVDKAKVLQDSRAKLFYVTGSVKKQRQKAAAKKRLAKKLARDKFNFKEFSRSNNHSFERKKNDKFKNQEVENLHSGTR